MNRIPANLATLALLSAVATGCASTAPANHRTPSSVDYSGTYDCSDDESKLTATASMNKDMPTTLVLGSTGEKVPLKCDELIWGDIRAIDLIADNDFDAVTICHGKSAKGDITAGLGTWQRKDVMLRAILQSHADRHMAYLRCRKLPDSSKVW